MTRVDLDEKKIAKARENISRAGAFGSLQAVHGDALEYVMRVRTLRFASPTFKRRKAAPSEKNQSFTGARELGPTKEL